MDNLNLKFYRKNSNTISMYLPKGADKEFKQTVTESTDALAKAIFCGIMRYKASGIQFYATQVTIDSNGFDTKTVSESAKHNIPNLKEYPQFTKSAVAKMIALMEDKTVAVGVNFLRCKLVDRTKTTEASDALLE